jgi:hypothetical protein
MLMKERKFTKKVLFILILLALAAVPLMIAGVGWAQEGDQSATNQETTGIDETSDMVITDPEADLSAIVAQTTGATSSSTVIPAAAFVDDGFGDQSYGLTFSSAYVYPYGPGGVEASFCMQAPVYLPDGATVTTFSGHVYDNDPDADIWRVELRRAAYTSLAGSTAMANAPTSGASSAFQATLDNSIVNAVVDNEAYAYFAAVCTGTSNANLRLYAVQVFYTQ